MEGLAPCWAPAPLLLPLGTCVTWCNGHIVLPYYVTWINYRHAILCLGSEQLICSCYSIFHYKHCSWFHTVIRLIDSRSISIIKPIWELHVNAWTLLQVRCNTRVHGVWYCALQSSSYYRLYYSSINLSAEGWHQWRSFIYIYNVDKSSQKSAMNIANIIFMLLQLDTI